MKSPRILFALIVLSVACNPELPSNAPVKDTATDTVGVVPMGEPPKVGQAMPQYSAVRLDGSPYNVDEQKGTVTLLNIWATWCTPCRYEIPELKAMHAELSPRGFEVVGVTIDDIDSISLVKSFAADQEINYPIVLDPNGRLSTMFRTVAIPMSILLDREGTIVWMKYGMIRANDKGLREALAKVGIE